MSFEYQAEFGEEYESDLGHLVEMATDLDIDCEFASGHEFMEEEQAQQVAAKLLEEINSEQERRRKAREVERVCGIGHYDGDYCAICGGRKPGTQPGYDC